MLTKELIRAVLQGLPTSSLPRFGDHLLLFCRRIESALKYEVPPLHALKHALQEAGPQGTRDLIRALKESRRVQSLPNLPRRQQQLLAALRLSGPTTCGMLSRAVAQDRSNTRKRLAALVASGWVGKFDQWGAVFYFAIPSPSAAAQVTELDQAIEAITALPEPASQPRSNPFAKSASPTSTTSTTPSTPSTPPPPPQSNNIFRRSPGNSRQLFSVADFLSARPGSPPVNRSTNRPIDQSTHRPTPMYNHTDPESNGASR
ncbi:MAG: hypothetical protein WD751_09985 [Anaerolineales bacterium]